MTTAAQWTARRREISELSQKYVWGTVPPRPKIDRFVLLDEKHADGYTVRNVRLEFGPRDKGTMRMRVYIPDGGGPFPVLINSSLQGWAASLIRRGYISAGFAGNDTMDDADALAQLYPDYDFALLPRRGWAAGLVADYLYSLPQVDKKHIAIFGYSRDGKMAVIAAALDPRITAVIAGSTGVGGVLPWRAAGERGFGEGIESTTRFFPTWFAPQLRFFTGREDRLPVDGNLLAAMIAPRSLLMEWGNNDQVSNTWGNEQTYYSALKVYKLLGAPDRIATLRVPGFHGENDEEADLDWLDQQFGRSTKKWTSNLIFQWNWDAWRTQSKTSLDLTQYPKHTSSDMLQSSRGKIATTADWEKKSAELRKSVLSMLGTEPPKLSSDSASAFLGAGATSGGSARSAGGAATGTSVPALTAARPAAPRPQHSVRRWALAEQLRPPARSRPIFPSGSSAMEEPPMAGWNREKSEAAVHHILFAGIGGDLFTPTRAGGYRLPAVIWLHGYSYPLGYMWVYHSDLHPILALVHAGYAGTGLRPERLWQSLVGDWPVLRPLSDLVALWTPGGGCARRC